MKICKGCGDVIPNSIVIDGVRKKLNREYCLKCVPYGSHSSYYRVNNPVIKTTKTCTRCKKEKDIESFYKNGNRRHSICKDCHKEMIKETYIEKINKINNYKANIGCEKCGEKRVHLLDFHHKDKSEKDFNISDKTRASFNTLLKEIEKCSVLCANCHRDFHHLEFTEGITIEYYLHGKVLK